MCKTGAPGIHDKPLVCRSYPSPLRITETGLSLEHNMGYGVSKPSWLLHISARGPQWLLAVAPLAQDGDALWGVHRHGNPQRFAPPGCLQPLGLCQVCWRV